MSQFCKTAQIFRERKITERKTQMEAEPNCSHPRWGGVGFGGNASWRGTGRFPRVVSDPEMKPFYSPDF